MKAALQVLLGLTAYVGMMVPQLTRRLRPRRRRFRTVRATSSSTWR